MESPFTIAKDREIDVLGFGTNAVDFLIRVPYYPKFDSKVELVDYVQAAGGEIATTLVGLQRLGMRTAYIGRFGSDAAGDFGLGSLRGAGVDVSMAEVVAGATTQIAFILIDETSGERTVIWKRDTKLSYTADDVPVEMVGRSKILHLTPHDGAACVALAAEAKRTGTIVSIDLDNQFDRLEDVLGLVDIIIASADLPRRMFDTDSDEEAITRMQERFGSTLAGITLGESGSLVRCRGEFIRTPGFPVPGGCKDTTGAGDAFRTGLIFGLLAGGEIENALRKANAVASLKCRAIGGRTALPTVEELNGLLKSV